MNSSTARELRMLREVGWFFLSDKVCCFCGRPLISLEGFTLTFGHRRHMPIHALLTLHHEDEDRSNNDKTNLSWAHTSCHKSHHMKQRKLRKELPNGEETNDEETGEEEVEEAEGTIRR